jgi:mxaJ protein
VAPLRLRAGGVSRTLPAPAATKDQTMTKQRFAPTLGVLGQAVALAIGMSAAGAANAAETEPPMPDLRICASEVEPPFSQKDGKGFENQLAKALAKTMGRKAIFVWSPKPAIFQVRDQLEPRLCDVVMGVDFGDERLLTSRPYYRSSYVLITRADRNITASDWTDPQIKSLDRFVVRFFSPGETIVKRLGKYEDNMAYLYSLINFKSPRNQYVQIPGDRLVGEVANGKADIGIAFAPEVARYVKMSPAPLRMTMMTKTVTRADGAVLPVHFDQSIGVRRDSASLLAEIETALAKLRPRIDQILEEEGIPVVSERS